ncbi:MAG TPA: reductive dehalogenase [Peptococcaceae bacterium]|nr:reductive dehalogenase [Peptococcaceae bacterium]
MPDTNESNKTTSKGISRRNFFKGAGLLAATAAMAQLPLTGNNTVQAATANSINDLYEISKDFKRFDQKNEMFCRMEWDPKFMPPPKPLINTSMPGYSVLDQAAGFAGWTGTNSLGTQFGWRSGDEGFYSWASLGNTKPPQEPWQASPEEAAHVIKLYAQDLGIAATGITTVDIRFFYSHYFHRGTKKYGEIKISDTATKAELLPDGTRVIPSSMKYVIVMLASMPYEMMATAPYGVSHGGTGFGYSIMALYAATMAEFIRGLGYNAIPLGGDTALCVPQAIAAGLGEAGRNGMLISKVGARVRIFRVMTDLPLATDKPINLGVREFCKSCEKCARECPAQAIPYGDMTTEGPNISNHHGIKKWYVNAEKCRLFWNENGGITCIRCIATCPYNKPDGYWTHALGNKIAPILGGTLVTIDDMMGYGKIVETKDYWKRPLRN